MSQATNIPDRTTVWTFENRIGEAGAKVIFDGVTTQLLLKGFIARGGQSIDATLVPAPRQSFPKEDKDQRKDDAMPADYQPTKRRHKDLMATWTKKHGKSHYGYKRSVNVDKQQTEGESSIPEAILVKNGLYRHKSGVLPERLYRI